MDSVFAFVTKDAAVIVSEMTVNSDITVLLNKKDKINEILNRDLMVVTGDPGDVNAHTDYLKASLNL
jgi:20S proteasome alpha/beta subunit